MLSVACCLLHVARWHAKATRRVALQAEEERVKAQSNWLSYKTKVGEYSPVPARPRGTAEYLLYSAVPSVHLSTGGGPAAAVVSLSGRYGPAALLSTMST
jgi:hypothetical protein